jgi:membrane fusion protein (multidrug efflux system)
MSILKRHTYSFVPGIALIALLVSSCSGDKKGNAQGGGPTPVSLQEVQRQPAIYYDQYPGTVVALSQVELRAQVSGYITGIYFKEGDHVHKGQRLYEIDRSKYQATYAQAQANLQVAKANQDKAQKDADRYIYLNKQDAIAKQVLDHALTDLENAKSQVASAKADLVKAQTDLNFSQITAPFDGIVGISEVKLGALVTASQTLLNTISTADPVAVDFVVNEKQIGRFQAIKTENVPANDSLFTLLMPDNSLYPQPGKLALIDRAVDPQTGSIKVRTYFPNPTQRLTVGMSCIVRVHSQEGSEQILIPAKATIEQMGEYFVFVAKDTTIASDKDKKDAQAGPGMVAQQKKVMLGQTINDNVIVKSGLEPGERLIVEGIQKLRDGAPITLGKPQAPAAKQ